MQVVDGAGYFCGNGFDHMDDVTMIHLENLTLGYQRHPAIHHLTLDIANNDMVAIVGPNGAGKSTLLKGLMGQLKPLEGSISFSACSAKDIAYLPQKSKIDLQFPITVSDMAAMGLWRSLGVLGALDKAGATRVAKALECVGLSGFENRQIGTLSGGQLQRLLFARLLLQDAKLLLLDEPFNAIDEATEKLLISLLLTWHGEGKTILTVWHDIDGVAACFPKTLLLARKQIAYGKTDQVLTPDNLDRARKTQMAFNERAEICTPGR